MNNDSVPMFLGCLMVAAIMAFGAAQIYAGYLGIEIHLGGFWAWIAVGLAFVFRFTLPVTIGAYFGAADVWGWPWYGAFAFAAPGLAFMVLMMPGALAGMMGKNKGVNL